MFRIRQYMNEIKNPTPIGIARKPPGPVVIWNLIRRCNLTCKHCYSISADHNFPNELSTSEIFKVIDDLKAFGVPVLILSGGEPLLRPDIYEISTYAKEKGFYVGLSTNGTLINEENIGRIAEMDYNYVGISLDGLRETHDKFRRKEGAFEASLHAARLCRDANLKIGLRFTITQDNEKDLPAMLKLMHDEKIDKFYLSHLNYSGRGNRNRKDDATFQMTRNALDMIFETCWQDIEDGINTEYVTGNNDADGVYLLQWVEKNHPEMVEHIKTKLQQWGGNSSGVNVANIDNLGEVHPDTYWWHYSLGNVKQRPFSEIWMDTSDPMMKELKKSPRTISGRCHDCTFFNICGGNTRIRAMQLTGDPWSEDPGCYLTDEEIGLPANTKERNSNDAVAI
ncbi:MAG: heme d1 biosynthesis radical SAM protein NirJ [Proteobacteria bacterium]|nr:heme d1 biosynthesis radical SAM protein NirJ [Pseudomonadota bacterium]NOG61757.1 heme d1 biosynthesis radical SAM protein NirJ [Pseudomonadota bacterium]